MNIECPVCGSTNTQKRTSSSSVQVLYGPSVTYVTIENQCRDCGEEGDFDAENDNQIEHALESSKKASVTPMLNALAAQGISNAYLERALGLPTRTVARWKNGELSSSALALLRIVRTFPWILEVADNGFSQDVVASSLIRTAGELISNVIQKTTTDRTLQVAYSRGEVAFEGAFSLATEQKSALPTPSKASLNFLGTVT